MYRKLFSIVVIAAVSCSLLAQNADPKTDAAEKKETPVAADAKTGTKDNYPVQAITTDAFDINMLTFNRKIDPRGKGELLLVEFALTPNTEYKYKLYVHVIASVENEIWAKKTIFGTKVFLNGLDTVLFVPYPNPDDLKNFEYQIDGKTLLQKFPHDYKTGIDPSTKAPYVLDRYTAVQTQHLAPYKKKFKYFNYATIIIFDDEGKVMFRQIYKLDKYRH